MHRYVLYLQGVIDTLSFHSNSFFGYLFSELSLPVLKGVFIIIRNAYNIWDKGSCLDTVPLPLYLAFGI